MNLQKLFNECKQELDGINIPYAKNSYITTCNCKARWGDCSKDDDGSYRIRISNRCLKSDVLGIKTTIIHELLHSVPNGMNHTGNWKKYANIVNNELGYNIKRTTSANEKGVKPRAVNRLPFKYKVVCENCGKANYYKRDCLTIRIIKNPDADQYCWCGKCGSRKLVVYEV